MKGKKKKNRETPVQSQYIEKRNPSVTQHHMSLQLLQAPPSHAGTLEGRCPMRPPRWCPAAWRPASCSFSPPATSSPARRPATRLKPASCWLSAGLQWPDSPLQNRSCWTRSPPPLRSGSLSQGSATPPWSSWTPLPAVPLLSWLVLYPQASAPPWCWAASALDGTAPAPLPDQVCPCSIEGFLVSVLLSSSPCSIFKGFNTVSALAANHILTHICCQSQSHTPAANQSTKKGCDQFKDRSKNNAQDKTQGRKNR